MSFSSQLPYLTQPCVASINSTPTQLASHRLSPEGARETSPSNSMQPEGNSLQGDAPAPGCPNPLLKAGLVVEAGVSEEDQALPCMASQGVGCSTRRPREAPRWQRCPRKQGGPRPAQKPQGSATACHQPCLRDAKKTACELGGEAGTGLGGFPRS